ncbi:DUF2339 domain-containing protein [Fredinandcohnia humi]
MADLDKLEEIEKRVDELRKEAHELKILIHSIKRQAYMGEQHPLSETIRPAPAVPKPEVPSHNQNQPKPKKPVQRNESIDWEKQIGQVWLPRIFIFVLLVGVMWAFKAASDYGLINEPVKILLGYLASGLLIYLGLKQMKKKRNALGQVLLGGSVVTLLIVTFAMHVLYGLVPFIITFPLNIGWIALGIYFANHFNSQALAVVTAIGGYLIPFLIESENPSALTFIVFETIYYGALLAFAIRKKFNIVYHVAFAFLHFTLLAGAIFQSNGELELFAFAIIVQHLFLLVSYLYYPSFEKEQLGIVFGSFLVMVAWCRVSFQIVPFEWVVLFFFVLYVGLSIYFWKTRKGKLPAVLSMASLSILTYLISRFQIEDISGLLVIQGLLSLYLGMLAGSKLKQAVGAFIYFGCSYVIFLIQFEEILSIQFLNWLILIGSLFVLKLLIKRMYWMKEDAKDSLIKVLEVITMLLILVFITLVVGKLTDPLSMSIGYMTISITWALYAFIGIVVGSTKDYKPFRVFGLTLLFITLGKLIFFDLSYVSIFIRALLFMGLGVIGILGSRVFYKSKK